MSDFHDIPTRQKARKVHRCGPCCYPIVVGETYVQQTGFWEGRPYRNRYHQECWDVLTEECIFEYSPGDFEPPERLRSGPNTLQTAQPVHQAGEQA